MRKKSPQNRRLGYARISTCGQTSAAQFEQLLAAGCTQICREKVKAQGPAGGNCCDFFESPAPATC